MNPHSAASAAPGGYRPDIDGLRAIAVLAIVVFHINKSWLPGGFVGVDVFFVISGFLITGILRRRLEDNAFSFADFYLARARRILPAALFCITVTLAAGAFILLPSDLRALGKSALYAVFSAGNIYFWHSLDTSYFAPSSETVPLLHLWSLAVEEQFYLFWPLGLWAMHRRMSSVALLWGAVVLAALSFALAQATVVAHHSFAYYMLPTRAGELLVGAAASMVWTRWNDRIARHWAELLGAAGLFLVGASVWMLTEKIAFPGLAAVPATVGAALVIVSGGRAKTVAGRLLSVAPLVWIGLISYSLYLWHWPVLAFFRYAYGQPSGLAYLVCVALMVALAISSYWLVERPFRATGHGSRVRAGIQFGALAGAVASMAAALVIAQGSLRWIEPRDYAAQLATLDDKTQAAYAFAFNCQMYQFEPAIFQEDRCVLGNRGRPAKVLIWGDSNAAHYVGYLKAVAEKQGVAMRNFSLSQCVPILDGAGQYTPEFIAKQCEAFNAAIRERLDQYEVVVIGANWIGYAGENYRRDIERTVAALSARMKHVVIALKVPTFDHYDRNCRMKALKLPSIDCEAAAQAPASFEHEINGFLAALAGRYPNVSTLTVRPLLCGSEHCSAQFHGEPVYFDPGHLSMRGSELLGLHAMQTHGAPPALLVSGGSAASAVNRAP